MIRIASIIFAAGCLLMSGCSKGEPLDFVLSPLDGSGDKLISKAYAGKPIVVYVWATWCGPCKAFGPSLNLLADQYRPKGVEFLAVAQDELEKVKAEEKKAPHRMTVAVDTMGSLTDAARVTSLPTIIVLDKEHRIAFGAVGVNEQTQNHIRAALDEVIQ
ncbi:MAG TPA: TlpA disulfide reductase family protein [Fimbriimonas sp.]|nr:TlpA disulfide reductase family protein [Fimbriimonas sp.]